MSAPRHDGMAIHGTRSISLGVERSSTLIKRGETQYLMTIQIAGV